MLAIDVKRGVEATLERVFQGTGRRFDELHVRWQGKTAGILIDRSYGRVVANVIFPAVDETKEIDRDRFNQLIGYALHELGHAWFTENEKWDEATQNHGAFVSGLINGLEDPRIEQCVIDSGYAPNSRALFENLINQILLKSGHVEGDDLANIPFLLAVEGRRLNGYAICLPNPIDSSPYAEHLNWALAEARKADGTARVVEVAIELYKRLQQAVEQPEQDDRQGDQQDSQPEQGQQGDAGNPGDSGDDGDEGDSGNAGDSGNSGEQGDGDADGDGDGKADGEADDDKPSKKSGKKGKGKLPAEPDRDVEPDSFISDQLSDVSCVADNRHPRPDVGKPIFVPITFED